jgi:hypothetical protein
MASSVVTAGGRILLEDCENFTDAPWTTAGSPSIVAARTGNGFSIPAANTNQVSYSIPSGDQTDLLVFGGYLKWTAISSTPIEVIRFRSDTNTVTHIALRLQQNPGPSTGQFLIYRGTSSLATSPTSTVTTGTWYLIELRVKLHDTLGTAELFVDGVSKATFSGDTKNGGTKTVFDAVQLIGATGGAYLADDIYIRNDATLGP